MFFPMMKPSEIAGQTLKFAAAFLGVAMVAVDGAVFSGPMFRDGQKVFVLHAEQESEGNAVLRVLDIGDRAASEILDNKAKVDYLMARINDDAAALESRRVRLLEMAETVKGLENDKVELLALVKTANDNCDNYARQNSALDAEWQRVMGEATDQIRLLRVSLEMANQRVSDYNAELVAANAVIERYITAVGPLDPEPSRGINDEIAEQMRLMEPEEPANLPDSPEPPPVVEPGPTAFDAPGLVANTIVREGSVQDEAFRRLMFLTRGDKVL